MAFNEAPFNSAPWSGEEAAAGEPVTGTFSATIGDFLSVFTGTAIVNPTGTFAADIGLFTSVFTGEVAANVTGTFDADIGDFLSSFSGILTQPITGTFAANIGDFTSVFTGTSTGGAAIEDGVSVGGVFGSGTAATSSFGRGKAVKGDL